MHAKLAIAAFLLVLSLAGCATGAAPSGAPQAVAQLELLSMSPASGSEVGADTVLVAEIRYRIENYKPGVDYYIAPLFASNEGEGVTFNMLDRMADSPKVTAPEGTITVRYPIARELGSSKLVRPITMWFYLMERINARQTQVVGKTEALQFPTR